MEKKDQDGPIKIVRGSSWVNRITICTKDAQSVARYDSRAGIITVNAGPIRRANSIWFFMKLALLVFVLGSVITFLPPHYKVGVYWAFPGLFALWVIFSWKWVSRWHGAEHRVIDAYVSTGKASMKLARRFSPISKYCGGRMVVPLALTMVFQIAAYQLLRDNHLVLLYISFGVTFWMTMIGVHTKRIANSKIAFWCGDKVQRWLSVREPSDLHMQVAHAALVQLLVVHGKSKGFIGPGVTQKITELGQAARQ